MNDSAYNQLREASLRRKLTAGEEQRLQDYFAAHPAAQTVWEEERNLHLLLRQLPEAPLASNFTALVRQAVEHENRGAPASVLWHRWWPGLRSWNLAQKTATLAMILCLMLLSYYQYLASARATRARSVAEFSTVASWTSLETLQDFDAIRRLPPAVDVELLKNLQ